MATRRGREGKGKGEAQSGSWAGRRRREGMSRPAPPACTSSPPPSRPSAVERGRSVHPPLSHKRAGRSARDARGHAATGRRVDKWPCVGKSARQPRAAGADTLSSVGALFLCLAREPALPRLGPHTPWWGVFDASCFFADQWTAASWQSRRNRFLAGKVVCIAQRACWTAQKWPKYRMQLQLTPR